MGGAKKGASRLPAKKLTPQQKAAATRAKNKAERDAINRAESKKLAQIVNLHLAGYSLSDIGDAIGSTSEEVEAMLTKDTAKYVRTQPALRAYVRNFVSGKYTKLLEANWDEATDPSAPRQLEAQDRSIKILERMAKLHGAEMPVQSEVKLDAAPEAVDKLINALASGQGYGYDDSVFDVVDAEIVHDAVTESAQAEASSAAEIDGAAGDDDD